MCPSSFVVRHQDPILDLVVPSWGMQDMLSCLRIEKMSAFRCAAHKGKLADQALASTTKEMCPDQMFLMRPIICGISWPLILSLVASPSSLHSAFFSRMTRLFVARTP